MRRRLFLAMAVFGLAACDSGPTSDDIEKALNGLAASSPVLKGVTTLVVSDPYCSESNGTFACAAKASGGTANFSVQLRMRKQGNTWQAEFLSDPVPLT